ncbi:MAG TPA: response regulator [Polyangiaceae bacterium]|nr:response regulator [Polyangiaceae bacterium]
MTTETTPVVLVADDEPGMLALVGQHIKTMGYKVLEASDGEQAWTLAQEHLPDLVILDVMMPGMSGWEVCRKIREEVALAHTAIIMLTGIGVNLNQLTSPLYGADSYIDKPFAFPELDEKVRGALGKRHGSRPGLARTEPGASPSNGNGGEHTLLSTPKMSNDSDVPDAEDADDAWADEKPEVVNGADESILLVDANIGRRKAHARLKSKAPKAAAAKKTNGAAKKVSKAKAAKPKTVTKPKAKPSKPKPKMKAEPKKPIGKVKRAAAKQPPSKQAPARRAPAPKKAAKIGKPKRTAPKAKKTRR